MAGVAEMPAHPPQIKGMTSASIKDLTLEPTLTGAVYKTAQR
jgi:hypothetical protein